MTFHHPAHTISFDDLVKGLEEHCEQRLVYKNVDGDLTLYCYTKVAVLSQEWNFFTKIARGLVIDKKNKKIVATPFIKFHNVSEGERTVSIPDLPFETYEKVDGSLIIIFHHNGEWKTATKGSFISDQAKWAKQFIDQSDVSALNPNVTYLAEAVYPANKIVVRYQESGLILLGAYDSSGYELPFAEVQATAKKIGWRHADVHAYSSISDLVAHAKGLDLSSEGFVIRFSDGLRLKVKGDEYRRVHSLISRCTPLDIWHSMFIEKNVPEMRQEMPEEFWNDFDEIVRLFNKQIDDLEAKVKTVADTLTHLNNKEVAALLSTMEPVVKKFIFAYRNNGTLRCSAAWLGISQLTRPTGNDLPGYMASSAMNRVAAEDN